MSPSLLRRLAYGAAFVPLVVGTAHFLAGPAETGAEILSRAVSIVSFYAAGFLASAFVLWKGRPLRAAGLRLPVIFGLAWNGLALIGMGAALVSGVARSAGAQGGAADATVAPVWLPRPRAVFEGRLDAEVGCEPRLTEDDMDPVLGVRTRTAACSAGGIQVTMILVDARAGEYSVELGVKALLERAQKNLGSSGATHVSPRSSFERVSGRATSLFRIDLLSRDGRPHTLRGRALAEGSDAGFYMTVYPSDDLPRLQQAEQALATFDLLPERSVGRP